MRTTTFTFLDYLPDSLREAQLATIRAEPASESDRLCGPAKLRRQVQVPCGRPRP